MNRYFVVRITSSGEQRVSHATLNAEESTRKRDRLNEDAAHQGWRYSELRYAIRIADERELAVAA